MDPANGYTCTLHTQCHYQAWLTGLLFQSRFCRPCKFVTETVDPWRALHGRHESEVHPSDREMSLMPSQHVWAYGWHFRDSQIVQTVVTEGLHRSTQQCIKYFENIKQLFSLVLQWYNCFKQHYITNNTQTFICSPSQFFF